MEIFTGGRMEIFTSRIVYDGEPMALEFNGVEIWKLDSPIELVPAIKRLKEITLTALTRAKSAEDRLDAITRGEVEVVTRRKKNLQAWLMLHRKNWAWVSRELGVSRQYISQLTAGKRAWPRHLREKLQRICGTGLEF